MTPERVAIARRMRAETPRATWEKIANALGAGVSTVRRALDKDDAVEEDAPVTAAS